jgi:hypothetical protein
MADITKCKGTNCELRTMCYRYTAKDGYVQYYFMTEPAEPNESGKITKCDMFWGDGQERLIQHLKDICNNKTNNTNEPKT